MGCSQAEYEKLNSYPLAAMQLDKFINSTLAAMQLEKIRQYGESKRFVLNSPMEEILIQYENSGTYKAYAEGTIAPLLPEKYVGMECPAVKFNLSQSDVEALYKLYHSGYPNVPQETFPERYISNPDVIRLIKKSPYLHNPK